MEQRNESLDFFPESDEEKKEESKEKNEPITVEHMDCQYCEDVGSCTYCKRGREELGKMKESK